MDWAFYRTEILTTLQLCGWKSVFMIIFYSYKFLQEKFTNCHHRAGADELSALFNHMSNNLKVVQKNLKFVKLCEWYWEKQTLLYMYVVDKCRCLTRHKVHTHLNRRFIKWHLTLWLHMHPHSMNRKC